MARSSEHFYGQSFGRYGRPLSALTRSGGRSAGGDWSDVSERHRCPVCNSGSWCQVQRDGNIVLCKRVESPRKKVNADGVEYFVHGVDLSTWEPPPRPPRYCAERADVETLDAAYRRLLSAAGLSAGDRAGLIERGLSAGDVARGGYGSLERRGRSALAKEVIDRVGEHVVATIPGVAVCEEGERWWWGVRGFAGLLVPVRDLDGRIVALKTRRREVEAGEQRYLYLSSARAGGPSAMHALHVPVAARAMRGSARDLVITEGELKADVATALSGLPVVSVPGVGSWRKGLDLARAWGDGLARVLVAFDSDKATNRDVARAQRALVDALRAERRWRVAVWEWPAAKGKGLDDYLLTKRGEREVRCAG